MILKLEPVSEFSRGGAMTDGADEQRRLNEVYDHLRLKLLDITKRNRMLSYGLSPRSKKHLQIVDEVLEEIYKKLVETNASPRIAPLEEPDDIPPEERSEDFVEALERAKVSDVPSFAAVVWLGRCLACD
jgi:hypothetical protein